MRSAFQTSESWDQAEFPVVSRSFSV